MANLCVLGGYPDRAMKCLRGSTFVSLQVNSLARYFDNVYVISHRMWLPSILRHLPFVPAKIRDYAGFFDYHHDNIHIFFPKYPPWQDKLSPEEYSDHHFRLVQKIVERNRLKFSWVHGFFHTPWDPAQFELPRNWASRVCFRLKKTITGLNV